MSDLRNAKVGDKVIISSRFNDNQIGVIEKITPKGFLKVGNALFYTDGRERASGWYRAHIKLATQEEVEKIQQRIFCKKVLRQLHQLNEITYDKAVSFAIILKELQKDDVRTNL